MTENIINDSEEIFKLNRCSQLFWGIEVLKFTDSSKINY